MNEAVFYFFYNLAHQSVFFDELIVFFAVSFPFAVMFLAFLYLLFYRKSLQDLIFVFFAAGVTWIIAHFLKILINIPRPFDAIANVSALFTESGQAFPSGHAAFFSALAFAIFFINKKAGYVFMLFALLIGLARIMAGVHFPVDILGGFTLGIAVAFLVEKYKIVLFT